MYDWNRAEGGWSGTRPRVVDESLRDGLQSVSAADPPIDRKIALLHAMVGLGVDVVSVGLPAAGPRAVEDAVVLAREIANAKLPLRPSAAARTVESDIRAIATVSERAGQSIDVYAFIGSSPIRCNVEGWPTELLVSRVSTAGATARRAQLPLCIVLEDTTRTPPDVLRTMFAAAIDAGAVRICLCDTVGHADPHGTAALVHFARALLTELGAPHLELDWHGHDDRGLALANALAAAQAGVNGVHGTAGGIGERCGNTAMEHLVVHLGALGARPAPTERAVATYRSLGNASLRATPRAMDALAPLSFRLNGEARELAVRSSRTLLEVLRYDLDLVGTKQGCDKGDCGACTVLIDGEPALACLTLAQSCGGRSVTTVESLSGPPALDPLLDAFDRRGAGQCGFCTGGMLMTAKALLARDPDPSRREIAEAISGNLCRCTGYGAIIDAVQLGARIARGEEPAGAGLPGQHVSAPLPPYRSKGS
jgi:2-isopropylmalate synthase